MVVMILPRLWSSDCSFANPFHKSTSRTIHQCSGEDTCRVRCSGMFLHSGKSEVHCHTRLLQNGVGKKERGILTMGELATKGSDEQVH